MFNNQITVLSFVLQQKKPESVYVTCAVYNYNGTEILGSYNDDDIYLFDRTKSENHLHPVHKYEGHRNAETGI